MSISTHYTEKYRRCQIKVSHRRLAVTSQAVLSLGMPGSQRANASRNMTGHAFLSGRDLPVGEIAWYGRIIVARARQEGKEYYDRERQSDEHQIRLLGPKPH